VSPPVFIIYIYELNRYTEKCNLHFDFVVFVSKTGEYRGITAGSRFLQGDKFVEIVAFSHEREVGVMTFGDDGFSADIPLRSMMDSAEQAQLVEFSTFKVRQAQLLKEYENGENEREREEKVKELETELREVSADLKSVRSENVSLRSREKSLKEKLEVAAEVEKELTKEKAKRKKSAKDLADSAKRSEESAGEIIRLRGEVAALRTENDTLRSENTTLRSDLERANKRQRTSESGDYRAVATNAAPFDVAHFEAMRVKNISFSATY